VTAVANLIQNALQASSDAEVHLAARDEGGEVRIVVDDGGPGVKESERARIFDDGYTTRPGGSGFGLAFVKRIVEGTLHGRVWCEDSDLGGARFVIAIPNESHR
jgi:signal transduction histidine kinase